ncbi:MAG: hypothetical protein J6Y80_01020, partial [Victivallales bacterium]|nr:hypothetical protein [Victivallales bacterium]
IALADPIRGELLLTPAICPAPDAPAECEPPAQSSSDWNELEVTDPPPAVPYSRGKGRAAARNSRNSRGARGSRRSRGSRR